MPKIQDYCIKNNIPEHLKNSSGIYIIRTEANSKIYIGSAVKLSRRLWQHVHRLKKGVHQSPHLQKHFNKYPPGTLTYNLLEACSAKELIEREQYYLNKLKPFKNNGFNTATIAGATTGYKHTDECKSLMGEKKKGMKMSAEVCEIRRMQWLGRKHTPEAIENMRKAQSNKTYGEQARKNMSLAHLGYKQSQETKDKRAAALMGVTKNGIIVLNTETFIFYDSIKDAAIAHGIVHSTLVRNLTKRKVNKSSFIIA